jgi:hypothetical protein
MATEKILQTLLKSTFDCVIVPVKENSSGQGDWMYFIRNSLPAVSLGCKVSPRPAQAADLVKFQNRQYSLDERRTR